MKQTTPLIDFHSHILPRVDHGSSGMTETTKQLQLVSNAKVDVLVATPHFYPNADSADSFLHKVQAATERLQAASSAHSYPYYDKMSRIRTHIYRNPTENRTMAMLAKEMMLSESYFQHLYKQIFGVSVMSDVITARIEHGKYLLANTDDSVANIATLCGYRNDVHFMRQFKSTTGITPSQYRKQFRVSPAEVISARERQPYTLPTQSEKKE